MQVPANVRKVWLAMGVEQDGPEYGLAVRLWKVLRPRDPKEVVRILYELRSPDTRSGVLTGILAEATEVAREAILLRTTLLALLDSPFPLPPTALPDALLPDGWQYRLSDPDADAFPQLVSKAWSEG